MKIFVTIGILFLSAFFLSGCESKDKKEYYQACLEIADSMFTKNQFQTTMDYEKFKVQCKINTDDIYGKK